MHIINPERTTLVLIDLQQGITAGEIKPNSASDIVARASRLAAAFRAAGVLVTIVIVDFHRGFPDAPDRPCDMPTQRDPKGPSPHFAALDPGLVTDEGDLRIVKRQWGAFHGTELDLQLRRRGIDTIVLAGIATNMGVESTARDAWERGYTLLFVENAMGSFSDEMHGFALKHIFPRLGFVRDTEQVERMLTTASLAPRGSGQVPVRYRQPPRSSP